MGNFEAESDDPLRQAAESMSDSPEARLRIEAALREASNRVINEIEAEPLEREVAIWIEYWRRRYILTNSGEIVPLAIDETELEGLSAAEKLEKMDRHRQRSVLLRRNLCDNRVPLTAGQGNGISTEALESQTERGFDETKIETKVDRVINQILFPEKLETWDQAEGIQEGQIHLWAQLFLIKDFREELFPQKLSPSRNLGKQKYVEAIDEIQGEDGLKFLLGELDEDTTDRTTIEGFRNGLLEEVEASQAHETPIRQRDHVFPRTLADKILYFLETKLLNAENNQALQKIGITPTTAITRIMRRIHDCIEHPTNVVFTPLNNIKSDRLEAKAFIAIVRTNASKTMPKVSKKMQTEKAPKKVEAVAPATRENLEEVYDAIQAETMVCTIEEVPKDTAIFLKYDSAAEAKQGEKRLKKLRGSAKPRNMRLRFRDKTGKVPEGKKLQQDIRIKFEQVSNSHMVIVRIIPAENIYEADIDIANDAIIQEGFITKMLALAQASNETESDGLSTTGVLEIGDRRPPLPQRIPGATERWSSDLPSETERNDTLPY